jgi:hypothetical protein
MAMSSLGSGVARGASVSLAESLDLGPSSSGRKASPSSPLSPSLLTGWDCASGPCNVVWACTAAAWRPLDPGPCRSRYLTNPRLVLNDGPEASASSSGVAASSDPLLLQWSSGSAGFFVVVEKLNEEKF